jgi:hypothetical protein
MNIKKNLSAFVMVVSMLSGKISMAQNNNTVFPTTPLQYQWSSSLTLAVEAPKGTYNKHISDYQQEEIPGMKRRNTGIALTVLGTVLLATGIALVATASSLSYSASTSTYGGSQSSGDLGGALGVLAIPASLGLLIPGIYQWTKGARIMKASRNRKTSYVSE